MSPTLVDIARETKTSVSTVSRVLSGGAMANRISKATRDRVREVADRLGYRPNLLARSLRTRKTNTIALLVSDIANPFFGQIGSLIERGLARHGYSLMLCNSAEDAKREADYLSLVTQKGIDGLIVVPITRKKQAIADVVPEGMPLVILDRPIPGISASVASDQDQGAYLLCDTLAQAGVRQIAIVCGPQHVMTHRRRCEILSSRFEVVARHEGPANKETGRQAALKLVTEKPPAIVCTNNFLALGVMDSMVMIDKPPIIGVFDEIPMMHLLPLPIVCSMQDVPALAESCVTQLMKLLEPKDNGAETDADKIDPIVLPNRAVTNRAFEVLQFAAGAPR
jgi:LacI family transcriptional regulator